MAAQLLAYTFARHALCHRFTLHSLHLKLMLNRIPLYVMLLIELVDFILPLISEILKKKKKGRNMSE